MKSNAPTWIFAIAIIILGSGTYLYMKSTPVSVISVTATTTAYTDTTLGITITVPKTYTVDATQVYQVQNQEGVVQGVTFRIPEQMATGTNLSSDTALSVMKVTLKSTSTACSPYTFIEKNSSNAITTFMHGGSTFFTASSTQAGAGNRYEETVYTTSSGLSCYGIRYFVHYSVFENYPTGAIERFNMESLLSGFDTIRNTLVINGN